MGASVGPSPSRGRRKSLDAEINLVPFIDLLSMCICFLLMTAIWTEIGSIQIKQILGTAAPAVTPEAVDLQVQAQKDNTYLVRLERGGKVLQSLSIAGTSDDQKLKRLSQYLSQVMMAVSANGAEPNITARVLPSLLDYSQMVAILDVLRGFGIVNLAVVPTKE